jgi:hypothetical protein
MQIENAIFPLPRYYYSVMRKINRDAINTKITEKILTETSQSDVSVRREYLNLLIEYLIIFLTIENNEQIKFENSWNLIRQIWDDIFAKIATKLSISTKLSDNSFENIKSLYEAINSGKDIHIRELKEILQREITLADYRFETYETPEPKNYTSILYSSESLKFFSHLADRNLKLKN